MEQFTFPNCSRYFEKDYNNLRYKFPGSENIKNNYSQAFQDMFVLTMLNGKTNGTYVEIGGDHPVVINNTYLLEKNFGWKGISFEIIQSAVDTYNNIRSNRCLCEDATKTNYTELFKLNNFPKQIDYLQVDIEPAKQTLSALKKVDFENYRYSVITFETDAYVGNIDVIDDSRNYLIEKGYELVVSNVCNDGNPFEDWYVDPSVVSEDIRSMFKNNYVSGKEVILK